MDHFSSSYDEKNLVSFLCLTVYNTVVWCYFADIFLTKHVSKFIQLLN